MSTIGNSVFDLFGGAPNNASFSAQAPNVIKPVTTDQTNAAIANATGAGTTAGNAVGQQANLAGTLYGQAGQGVATQSQLAQALQGILSGTGPNVAQNQLNATTGQNVANTGALIASNRGASSNAGLTADLAARQGAGIQQNAVGQSATLQAQQQIAAQNALQQLAASQVSQAQGGVNAAAQGALGQEQAQTGQQNALLQALQGYNNAQVQAQSAANSTNQTMAGINANNTATSIGGLFGGGASALKSAGGPAAAPAAGLAGAGEGGFSAAALAAKGGMVESGEIKPPSGSNPHIQNMQSILYPGSVRMETGGQVPGEPNVPGKNTPKNDVVKALLTPKEIVLPLSVTQSENPAESAKDYVSRILKSKKSEKEPAKDSDFKQALSKSIKNRKAKKMYNGSEGFVGDGGGSGQDTSIAMANDPGFEQTTDTSTQSPNANPAGVTVGPSPASQGAATAPGVIPDVNAALTEQQRAKTAEAQALGQQGKEESKSINDVESEINNIPTSQMIFDANKQKEEALFKAYQDKKIDPNQYYKNMGTTKTITNGIALILGGIGGALTRNGNPVLDTMNREIERDIDAQKSDKESAGNLWKMNKEQLQNDMAASAATRNQLYTGVQYQLLKAAANAKTPLEAARAQEANAVIEQEKANNRYRMSLLGSDVPAEKKIPLLVPPGMQAKAFDQLSKAKYASENEGSFFKQFEQAASDVRLATGGHPLYAMGVTPPSIKGLKQKGEPLIKDELGRYNPEAAKTFEENLPQRGDDDSTIVTKGQNLQELFNKAKDTSLLNGFNINTGSLKVMGEGAKAYKNGDVVKLKNGEKRVVR